MTFHREKPIFQQIIEKVENAILSDELPPEARIPGVRDYALTLEVNPNTVVRSFAELEQTGTVFKKRGLGYFVATDAKHKILARRREFFLSHELPQVAAHMHQLQIGIEVLEALLNRARTEQNEKE